MMHASASALRRRPSRRFCTRPAPSTPTPSRRSTRRTAARTPSRTRIGHPRRTTWAALLARDAATRQFLPSAFLMRGSRRAQSIPYCASPRRSRGLPLTAVRVPGAGAPCRWRPWWRRPHSRRASAWSRWTALPLLQLTIGAMGIELILLPEDHAEEIPPYVGFAVVFGVCSALAAALDEAARLREALAAPAIAVVLAAMVSLARKDDPVKPTNSAPSSLAARAPDRPSGALPLLLRVHGDVGAGHRSPPLGPAVDARAGPGPRRRRLEVEFEWAHVVYFLPCFSTRCSSAAA